MLMPGAGIISRKVVAAVVFIILSPSFMLQANMTIRIPREHHRFILGKSGKKLQDLEMMTSTKITIPRAEENSETIRIMGTKEGIDKARHELQCISDEQVTEDCLKFCFFIVSLLYRDETVLSENFEIISVFFMLFWNDILDRYIFC